MKQKILAMILVFLTFSFADWNGGVKEPNEYKKIDGVSFAVLTNGEELAWFAKQINAGVSTNGYIDNDIVLGADENTMCTYNWTPIGNATNAFKAVLLGNGHTVSGVVVPSAKSENGFFGVIGQTGRVVDLHVKKASIKSSSFAGGVAGKNYGTIQKVSFSGSVTVDMGMTSVYPQAEAFAGGIAAYNEGEITAAMNYGSVSAVGGAINSVNGWSGGSSRYGYLYAGGIAGRNAGSILLSENSAAVSESQTVGTYGKMTARGGGIAGHNSGSVAECFNSGKISVSNTKKSGCDQYYCSTSSSNGGVVGLNDGTVRNTVNMQTANSSIIASSGKNAVGMNNYGNPAVTEDLVEKLNTTNGTETSSGNWMLDGEKLALKDYALSDLVIAWNGSATQPELIENENENYYLITSAFELAWVASTVNAGKNTINAKLGCDIYFGETQSSTSLVGFTPIGNKTVSYNGVFDGQNYSINGINVSSSANSGLFGVVGTAGVVRNVIVKNAKVSHSGNGGGIAGSNMGLLENVSFSGQVVGASYSGGIVGVNDGYVSMASVEGTVTANNCSRCEAGGIAGRNNKDIYYVKNSASVSAVAAADYGPLGFSGGIAGVNVGFVNVAENIGKVSGSGAGVNSCGYAQVGGVVGENNGSINNAVNKGALSKDRGCNTVDHYAGIGGVVGANSGSAALVKNSYALLNAVSGTDNYRAGVIGINQSGANAENCAFDKTLLDGFNAVGKNSAVTTNVIGMTTAEMKTAAFAWSLNTTNGSEQNSEAWSFNNDYPFFADEKNHPIYRLTFNDGIFDAYQYSTYLGTASSPETPETDPGYTFVAWVDDDGVVFRPRNTVSSDMVYTAIFALDGFPRYQITFIDGKTTFSVVTNEEGKLENISDGVNASENEVFDGWYMVGGTERVTTETVFEKSSSITAKYTEKLYKVTFLDYDGTVFKETEWKFGSVPAVENPTRKRTNEFAYIFKGWSPEIVAVSGEATYTAVYEEILVEYVNIIINGSDTSVVVGEEFILPEALVKEGYTFEGWFDTDGNKLGNAGDAIVITGKITIEGKFIINTYTISFVDFDGSVIKKENLEYGTTLTLPDSPSRDVNENFSYVFKAWTPEVTKVVADALYKATYDSTRIESSSSAENSSSSTGKVSSSSVATSSSSTGKVSSSSVTTSSSSTGKVSSSSVATSSSNTGKISSSSVTSSNSSDNSAILANTLIQNFKVSSSGKMLQFSGARMNSKIAVFDMQGREVYTGIAYAQDFVLVMPRSGAFLVVHDNLVLRVDVK